MNVAERVLPVIGAAVTAVMGIAWLVANYDLPGAPVACTALVFLSPLVPFSGFIAGGVVWMLTRTRLPRWLATAMSLLVVVGVYWLVVEGIRGMIPSYDAWPD